MAVENGNPEAVVPLPPNPGDSSGAMPALQHVDTGNPCAGEAGGRRQSPSRALSADMKILAENCHDRSVRLSELVEVPVFLAGMGMFAASLAYFGLLAFGGAAAFAEVSRRVFGG